MTTRVKEYFTGKMFFRQFFPATVSAVGLALGDMADAIVVGQSMGVTGLAAISLALPVFMVFNVLMHGLGIGGSIRFATLSAEGKKEEAIRSFQGIMTAAAAISIGIAVLGNLFMDRLLFLLGADPADALLYAASRTYVRITVAGTPLFFLAYILNYYLRNDDCERIASVGFTVGNVSDIILNIVLVLGMDMGAAGAAWATLAGLVISIAFYSSAFLQKKLTISFHPLMPDFKGVFRSFRVGFASSVQFLFSMVFILTANNLLMNLGGSVGVGVFDMIQNASFLILYLYDGTAKAAQPIISTYCGERNESGKKHILRLSLVSGIAIALLGSILVAVFPQQICLLFGLEGKEAVDLGVYALRIFCLSTGFAGISIIMDTYYQSCGDEKTAFLLTTLRGLVILLPMTLVFSRFGLKGFWGLYPATELLTVICFLLWLKFGRKKTEDFETDRVFTRTISNKDEELGPLLGEIEEFCDKWSASIKQSYFVNMAVEELCSVIKEKGFKREKGYIQVTLIAEKESLFSLHIRDSAVSFNPFAMHTEKAGAHKDFDMDAMGVLVIREKAREFSYRRYQGFNTLIVKI